MYVIIEVSDKGEPLLPRIFEKRSEADTWFDIIVKENTFDEMDPDDVDDFSYALRIAGEKGWWAYLFYVQEL